MLLLQTVAEVMAEAGYRLVDADCVLMLERPKIAPHRDAMRRNLAAALGVDVERIGLKATTTEGLGFEGRGEGVAAQAVVLLEQATS
jgi:2-C-methyl-D-erythritol 2,4-cyclodiphosphate synthase